MRKLFALSVALLTATTMSAQSNVGTYTITPKMGITVTDTDADSKAGFVGGVEVGYQLYKPIAVTVGLNYTNYRSCATVESPGRIADENYSSNYLSMPILVNYYVTKGLALKSGVEPAIKLNTKTMVGDWTHDTSKYHNGFMMTIPVGASYEYMNYVLDARYNFGVTNAVKDTSSKLSSFVITLGYKFSL